MRYIVDMQGFQAPEGEFIFKELAFIPVQRNALPKVYCFLPPKPLDDLPVFFQNANRWIETKHHGIPWQSGNIPYTELTMVLQLNLQFADKVYVKGAQKVKWLSQYLRGISIVDLEADIGCPSLNSLPDNGMTFCSYHRNCKCGSLPVCAMQNISKLVTWMLDDEEMSDLAERMSRCQCDCPHHYQGKMDIDVHVSPSMEIDETDAMD